MFNNENFMTDPKTMTAEETANNIVTKWDSGTYHGCSGRDSLKAMISNAIQQAVDQARKEGFAQAREMGASFVRNRRGIPEHHSELADKIMEIQPPRDGAE